MTSMAFEKYIAGKGGIDDSRKFKDLLNGRFKLAKVLRVERKNDAYEIFGKVANFIQDTIREHKASN